MKYLYVYRENTSRQVSAKTRSWERAEERAQEIRDENNIGIDMAAGNGKLTAIRRELEITYLFR